ncbi:MAG: type II CAAX endopeptidase family protein [Clostridia bacterium]|nr:type II CAAX endopeptidase family protein [Clostridia bacterium]
MTADRKRATAIIAIVVFCCAVMAVVDGIIQPHYAVKSAVKVALFLILPFGYSFINKELSLKSLFMANKKGIGIALLLCIPVYIVILGGYLLLKDVFDFSAVTSSLTGNIGVSKENFPIVALYISFVNSLLEEFFFRGFAFLTLRKAVSEKTAYIFSSAVFALYHIAIMTGWFSAGVFAITLSGLFIGGLIFNLLNSKSGNIYTSWFVHMFANFAINTIGFMLFGII